MTEQNTSLELFLLRPTQVPASVDDSQSTVNTRTLQILYIRTMTLCTQYLIDKQWLLRWQYCRVKQGCCIYNTEHSPKDVVLPILLHQRWGAFWDVIDSHVLTFMLIESKIKTLSTPDWKRTQTKITCNVTADCFLLKYLPSSWQGAPVIRTMAVWSWHTTSQDLEPSFWTKVLLSFLIMPLAVIRWSMAMWRKKVSKYASMAKQKFPFVLSLSYRSECSP